jgi:hypothetical protein
MRLRASHSARLLNRAEPAMHSRFWLRALPYALLQTKLAGSGDAQSAYLAPEFAVEIGRIEGQ